MQTPSFEPQPIPDAAKRKVAAHYEKKVTVGECLSELTSIRQEIQGMISKEVEKKKAIVISKDTKGEIAEKLPYAELLFSTLKNLSGTMTAEEKEKLTNHKNKFRAFEELIEKN